MNAKHVLKILKKIVVSMLCLLFSIFAGFIVYKELDLKIVNNIQYSKLIKHIKKADQDKIIKSIFVMNYNVSTYKEMIGFRIEVKYEIKDFDKLPMIDFINGIKECFADTDFLNELKKKKQGDKLTRIDIYISPTNDRSPKGYSMYAYNDDMDMDWPTKDTIFWQEEHEGY